MSLKVAEPKIRFKTVQLDKPLPDGSTFDSVEEEEWMKHPNEIINRRRIIYLQGPLSGPMEKTLEVDAKTGTWWVSEDGACVYVGTQWFDARFSSPGLAPRANRLFKSVDHGKTFNELKWPVQWSNHKFIAFRTPETGYVIGTGPNFYRTQDGGDTWKTLVLPPQTGDQLNPQTEISVIDLDPHSGALLLAVFVANPQKPLAGYSAIFRLDWAKDDAVFLFALPQQVALDVKLTPSGDVYLLTARLDKPEDMTDGGTPNIDIDTATKELRYWPHSSGGQSLAVLKTFGKGVDPGALYLLQGGALVVDAVVSGATGTTDVVYLSADSGKNWTEKIEGRGAQGVYTNPTTGERFRVQGHTLYQRMLQ